MDVQIILFRMAVHCFSTTEQVHANLTPQKGNSNNVRWSDYAYNDNDCC